MANKPKKYQQSPHLAEQTVRCARFPASGAASHCLPITPAYWLSSSVA